MEYVEKVVDLVYNNTGKDKNGRILELEEFKKVVNSERLKELIKADRFYIQNSYNLSLPGDINSHFCVDPKYMIGKVLSIDTEKLQAVIKLKKDFIDNTDISDMKLYFVYLGKIKDGGFMYDLTILYSVFQSKITSCYN